MRGAERRGVQRWGAEGSIEVLRVGERSRGDGSSCYHCDHLTSTSPHPLTPSPVKLQSGFILVNDRSSLPGDSKQPGLLALHVEDREEQQDPCGALGLLLLMQLTASPVCWREVTHSMSHVLNPEKPPTVA